MGLIIAVLFDLTVPAERACDANAETTGNHFASSWLPTFVAVASERQSELQLL